MTRETAINVLLGTLLIVAAAAPFVAVVGALWLAFYVTDTVVKHFWPSVSIHPDAMLNTFMCLGVVCALFRQFRKRLWTNAFLSLTAGLTFALCWQVEPVYPSSRHFADNPSFWLVVLVVLIVSQEVRIPRRAFFAAAALNTTVFALTAGLFGPGTMARIVSTCAWLAVVAWMIINGRRDEKWDGARPGALSLKSS